MRKLLIWIEKDNSTTVVQRIKREDGSLPVTGEEISKEIKERYGKETLDVKELDSKWYEKVENDTSSRVRIEEKRISEPKFSENCGHKKM